MLRLLDFRHGGLPNPRGDGTHAAADPGPGLPELQDVRRDGRMLLCCAAGGGLTRLLVVVAGGGVMLMWWVIRGLWVGISDQLDTGITPCGIAYIVRHCL